MKGVSIRQPWACFIAMGLGTTIFRSWYPKQERPLPLFLHVSRRGKTYGRWNRYRAELRRCGYRYVAEGPEFERYRKMRGQIFGSAVLTHVYAPGSKGIHLPEVVRQPGYSVTLYAWRLEQIEIFEEPVKWKGKPWLFEVPEETSRW